MRVLFVTQDFPPDVGGIQTYSWEVAQHLCKLVSTLEVVAPDHSDASTVDDGTSFHTTRVSGRADLLPITGFGALCRRAYSLQADVALHAQWQTVAASLVSRWTTGWPKRIACAAHGRELLLNPAEKIPGLRQIYDRWRQANLTGCDLLFPVSRYTGGLLRSLGVPNDCIRVVPNGTDPNHFQAQDGSRIRESLRVNDAPLLLTVGRLVPRKGIDTVLQALPTIVESAPGVQYVIAGTGPDESRLKSMVERLGLQSRVHFVGYVDHDRLPAYYSAADVFVMPARNNPPDVEGFGIVFLEANACGTPVIGARSGGMPDAIRDGETGLLVPPNNPSALATSATHLLTHPAEANALGQRGRARVVDEANWENVAKQIFDVLTQLE